MHAFLDWRTSLARPRSSLTLGPEEHMTTEQNKELLSTWQTEHGKYLLIGNEVKVLNKQDGSEYVFGCQIVWNIDENIIHYAIISNVIDDRIYVIVDRIMSEIKTQKESIEVSTANAFVSRNQTQFKDAVFSGKLYLICHSLVDSDGIISHLSNFGYRIEINDDIYYKEKASVANIDVFLSHDSRDKETFVRDLNVALSKKLIRTWLDEKSLMIGDRLTSKINEGLIKSRYCIVVLSKHFLENTGWCDREYRSIVSREINEKRDVLLPIWHGVTKADIIQYNLELADRVALNTNMGAASIAGRIKRKIDSLGRS